jgi:hypothetical protein
MSCKGGGHRDQAPQLYDTEGREVAWTRGIKLGLKPNTLRAGLGFWSREFHRQPSAGPMAQSPRVQFLNIRESIFQITGPKKRSIERSAALNGPFRMRTAPSHLSRGGDFYCGHRVDTKPT